MAIFSGSSRNRLFLALSAGLLISGCARQPAMQLPAPLRAPVAGELQATPAESVAKLQPATRFQTPPAPASGPRLLRGEADEPQPLFATSQPLSVNLESLPLPAFINEVFGNLLGISFQIDPALQKKADLVTLRVAQAQPPRELYRLARQVLADYGVGLSLEGDLLRFVPLAPNTSTELPILVKGSALPEVPVSHRPIFQKVPLSVVSCQRMEKWLKQFYNSPKLKIEVDLESNSMLLSGPPSLIAQVGETIRFFDQPTMEGRQSLYIEPVYMNVEQLSNQMIEVLRAEGYAVSLGVPPPHIAASVVVQPLKPSNAIIVFAQDAKVLEHIKEWARMFDSPRQLGEEQGLFLYPVQHTQAEEIAKLISPLLGGVVKAEPVAAAPVSPPVAGQPAGAPPASNTAAAQSPSRNPSLVVDNIRNALIYQGTAENWGRLLPILREIDKPAKLVLIEVTIAEITLSDQQDFGIEWLLSGVDFGHGGYRGTLGDSGLGLGKTGLTYTLVNSLGQTRAVLNALATNNQVNVLSTPRLMVKSGESASINVGDEVPVLSSQSTDSGSGQINGTTAILQQIQYRKTGINLSVKPVVHAGNRVDIEIDQEVSNADRNTISNISSPTISNRSIQTKLSLSDGGSVLLGGLISTSTSQGYSGIPLLGEIPVLGHLFRADKQQTSRTELVILVVPYVISDDEQARAITEAFRETLSIESPSPQTAQ